MCRQAQYRAGNRLTDEMARKLPDLSARPIVIRGNLFTGGLLFVGFGSTATWSAIATWGSDEFDWIYPVAGALFLPAGLWMMILGPVIVRIGDEVVSMTRRRTWWSMPRTSEWRVSEFECIRCDVTPEEDGSKTFHLALQHRSGDQVDLFMGYPLTNGDDALNIVNGLEKMLKLPVEWNEP